MMEAIYCHRDILHDNALILQSLVLCIGGIHMVQFKKKYPGIHLHTSVNNIVESLKLNLQFHIRVETFLLTCKDLMLNSILLLPAYRSMLYQNLINCCTIKLLTSCLPESGTIQSNRVNRHSKNQF